MTTLTAVYDLAVSPPTFEVLSFLAQAELARRAGGHEAMAVAFQPGPAGGFRADALPPDLPAREGMLWRICVAAARLVPSVREVRVLRDRAELHGPVFPPGWAATRPVARYGPAYHVDAPDVFRASESARRAVALRLPPRFATITLRQASYWPSRNSNVPAWQEAARWLERRAIAPVWIPDVEGTAPAGALAFDAAAYDLDLRLAAYEAAVVNLGVTNGPMTILHFTRLPHLIFKPIDPECPATGEAHLRALGLRPGGQWVAHGRLVWAVDDAPAIIGALSEFLA